MQASELLLEFISWGYKTPLPARAGTERRIERERQFLSGQKFLYANTPSHPPSRQVRRHHSRKGR